MSQSHRHFVARDEHTKRTHPRTRQENGTSQRQEKTEKKHPATATVAAAVDGSRRRLQMATTTATVGSRQRLQTTATVQQTVAADDGDGDSNSRKSR